MIFRGPDEHLTRRTAQDVADKLKASRRDETSEVRILGAAPAPITRLRNQWRFHLQLAAKDPGLIRALWSRVEQSLELPDGVELAVDVDPINAR